MMEFHGGRKKPLAFFVNMCYTTVIQIKKGVSHGKGFNGVQASGYRGWKD